LQDEVQIPEQILEDEDPQQSPGMLQVDVMQNYGPYLQKKMKIFIIKMQAQWDNKGMPLELQDWTLHQIFEGLININDDFSTVSTKDRLAPLIRMMPEDWDGSLEGHASTPSSFKSLICYIKGGALYSPRDGGCA